MLSKFVKTGLCALLLTAFWCATPEAQAQRRGGTRGGSGVGVYIGPGGVGIDYGRGGYYGDRNYRDGYYRDGYYRDGYWSGGRYYGPSRSGVWYDSYPRYYETDVVQSNYQAEPPSNARVRVILPDPNAEVFFNGSATQQRGTERVFETPSLSNGKSYSYEVKARWRDQNGQMVERTQTVNLQQGRESMVDFTRDRGERIPREPVQQDDPLNPSTQEPIPPRN